MAHGLSLITLVSVQNRFRSVFSDMVMVCVMSTKPGPTQTSWAPNKATFMSIGGLEFEKKLFKLYNFSEKDFIDKLSGPRVREAYVWPRKEVEVNDLKPISRKWPEEL